MCIVLYKYKYIPTYLFAMARSENLFRMNAITAAAAAAANMIAMDQTSFEFETESSHLI